MIALIRLEAPAGCDIHTERAQEPVRVGRYLGLFVRFDDRAQARQSLSWLERSIRPGRRSVVGLVVARNYDLVRSVVTSGVRVAALVFRDELVDGRLPAPAIERVWRQGLVGEACTEFLDRLDAGSRSEPDREVLHRLVDAAAAGCRVRTAARSVAMSEASLRRWCSARDLPSPGQLLSLGRLHVATHLLDRGVELPAVARLLGWGSARACRVALRRARDGSEPTI